MTRRMLFAVILLAGCSKAQIVSRHNAVQTIPVEKLKTHALSVSKARWGMEPGTQIGTVYGGVFAKPVKTITVDDAAMDKIGAKLAKESEDYLLRKGYILAGKRLPAGLLFRPKEAPKEPALLLEITMKALQASTYGLVSGGYSEANASAEFRLIDPRDDGVVFEQTAMGSALLPRSTPESVTAEAVILALAQVLGNPEFVRRMTEPRALHPGAPRRAGGPVFSEVDRPVYRRGENARNFALIVGVEKYKSLPAADFAERDAAAVEKHLRALGFPAKNVISLLGENATRSQLKAYLEEWLPKNASEDSTVFFYFSGHGAPSPETKQAYLVPYEGDAKFLKTTGYPLSELYASLERLPARRVVVALDACFSGAGGRSVLAKGTRPLVTKVDTGLPARGKLALLTAAGDDEITGALDAQGHGLFTYYLLEGLNAGAKNAFGDVTLSGLYKYLKPRVQEEARRQNRVQTPLLAGEGEVVLLDLD